MSMRLERRIQSRGWDEDENEVEDMGRRLRLKT